MTHPEARGAGRGFEPRWPTIAALGFLTLWIAILSLPMWSGQFLAAPYNDQYATGYAFREWAANQWKALGHFPLWNPEIYGGLPFVASMHGDVFYPTAWLRLLLPTDVAMNLGFFVHYVLAGLFMYWFLRTIHTSWAAAVVGGLAYQLSGVIGTYASPGHDGKLFVTTMLPLGFFALTRAVRDERFDGYALFALSVGLALLSPHPQMAQYYVIAAGIYLLYLAFAERSDLPIARRSWALGLGFGAVVVGVGISAIQYLPFLSYIPYSPRHESVLSDFAFSASYGIPWAHVPELVLSRFVGESFNRTYWGPNVLKLHSEYLGLAVLALAVLGAADRPRRRMILWFLGIGALFLLVALGSATPFYRLWWSLVPFVKSTRAPGMALYVVAFIVATFAAFGVDRLGRGEGRRHVTVWFVVAGGVVLLATLGVVGAVARSLALPGRWQIVAEAFPAIRLGALVSAVPLAVVAVAALLALRSRLRMTGALLLVIAVVGTDLWWNARAFWNYSRVTDQLFAPDEIKTFLSNQPRPFRVFNFLVYPQSSLMADEIAQWYGHHGNELHAFDVLNGRDGINLTFRNAGHPRLADLYAINYVIAPTSAIGDSIQGFRQVLRGVPTSAGVPATLFEREQPVAYARLVPAAVKMPDEQAIPTVLDPRVGFDQVVLLAPDAPVEPAAITSMPDPLSVSVSFEEWQAGLMKIRIAPAAPQSAYLVVSENWYPDWKATVDGVETPVVRGNVSLITVPVPEGAETVELSFESADYRRGKAVSFLSLGLVMLGLIVPSVMRKRASV